MKTLLLAVGLCVVLATGISVAADFTPSKSESAFAAALPGMVDGVASAQWKSHVDLWVVSTRPAAKAHALATDVIAASRDTVGESFCVHVHAGDWSVQHKLCWSAP